MSTRTHKAEVVYTSTVKKTRRNILPEKTTSALQVLAHLDIIYQHPWINMQINFVIISFLLD